LQELARSNTSKIVKLYFEEKIKLLNNLNLDAITQLAETVIDVYNNQGHVFTLGNGGGASVANGFAVDLRTHPFVSEDKTKSSSKNRFVVVDLCESAGMITGISNDIGSDSIFAEQIKCWVNNKDSLKRLLIAFSGSGNSRNVIEAINFSKKLGFVTSCISGRGGGMASKIVDIPIIIPGDSNFPGQTGKNNNNFHIEDTQVSVSHIIVGLLKMHVENSEFKQ